MILLSELVHIIGEEEKTGLVCIDDWRWSDVDHLANMGFKFDGDYHMRTDKEPTMSVYRKKDKPEEEMKEGKGEEYFYLEEQGKKLKRFKNFEDLISFFDTYAQPELDKNRQ